jgi:hypothetical protein
LIHRFKRRGTLPDNVIWAITDFSARNTYTPGYWLIQELILYCAEMKRPNSWLYYLVGSHIRYSGLTPYLLDELVYYAVENKENFPHLLYNLILTFIENDSLFAHLQNELPDFDENFEFPAIIIAELANYFKENKDFQDLTNELLRLSSNDDLAAIKSYSLLEGSNMEINCGWERQYEWEPIHFGCIVALLSPVWKSALGEEDDPLDDEDFEDDNIFEENLQPYTPLSLSEIKTEITLKPNPTTGELQVTSSSLQMETIQILDVVGKELMRISSINSQKTMLNVEALQQGLYFLKVVTEDGGQQTKKFVKH